MRLGSLVIPTQEVGDLWQLEGCVYGNGAVSVVLLLPFEDDQTKPMRTVRPTDEEWFAFLHQADDPATPIGKAFVRKASRQIDESIKWRVYKRDNYTCVYCGKSGVPMTVDHYLAQKFGGQTTMDNLVTACRPCNKHKGHMTIDEWKVYAAKKGLKDGTQVVEVHTD